MKTNKIKSIYCKEILDLLRDKKTLIMMVLVPLLLYPLIMVAALLISSAITQKIQYGSYEIAIVEENKIVYDKATLKSLIEENNEGQSYTLKIVECEDPEKSLQAEEIDAYAVIDTMKNKLSFHIYYLSSVTNSDAAANMLMEKLNLYKEKLSQNYLTDLGLDADYLLDPVVFVQNDQSSTEKTVGNILGKILPFLLITSILMGALYPAIDTTTGEKERGTLETLLTLPVKNSELIMGKFLAVSTISVVSALLNLVSMAFMGLFLSNLLTGERKGGITLDLGGFIPTILIVILCVTAFALFISAITMCVTSFAKSFKEANNYTTPLLLVIMLTGYIGFIPNIEFTPLMAAVPVANICLLIGNLLVFKYDLTLILIVLVSNIAYAAISVLALSRIYNSEDILFGESGVNLQIFTRRRELKKGGIPNFSDAVLVAALSMLVLLYAGTLLQVRFPFWGVLWTQLMLIFLPLFAAWYTKKDFRQTFSLTMPGPSGVLGAVLLELGTFLLITLLSVMLNCLWPQDTQAINESFRNMLEGVSFLPALFVIAIAPAVCEETLFRGYFLSAAQKKFQPKTAILIVAVMFGIYHLSLVKFFTTALLGIAFCYVVYKSKSIVLSCIMHFINNALSVFILYYGKTMEKILPFLFRDTLSAKDILLLLITGFTLAGIGILFINRSSNKILQRDREI